MYGATRTKRPYPPKPEGLHRTVKLVNSEKPYGPETLHPETLHPEPYTPNSCCGGNHWCRAATGTKHPNLLRGKARKISASQAMDNPISAFTATLPRGRWADDFKYLQITMRAFARLSRAFRRFPRALRNSLDDIDRFRHGTFWLNHVGSAATVMMLNECKNIVVAFRFRYPSSSPFRVRGSFATTAP